MIVRKIVSGYRGFSPITLVGILSCTVLAGILLAGCGGSDAPGDTAPDSATVAADTGVSMQSVAEFENAEAVESSAASYKLQLTLTPGDVYAYRLVTEGGTEAEGLKATEKVTYDYTLKIKSVNDDGSILMEMTYDRIRARTSVPAGVVDTVARTISFDSYQKADSATPGAESYRAIIGKPVILTVTAVGEVQEVANIEPIISALIKAQKVRRDSIPPAVLDDLRKKIKIGMYKANVEKMFVPSPPDSAIAAGAQWVRRDTVPLMAMVPSQSAYTYTLVDIKKVDDRDVGKIVVGVATKFPEKKIEDQYVSAVVQAATVDGNGETLVDLTTGMPISKQTMLNIHLVLDGTAKAGPQKGKTSKLNRTVNQGTKLERIRYTPANK